MLSNYYFNFRDPILVLEGALAERCLNCPLGSPRKQSPKWQFAPRATHCFGDGDYGRSEGGPSGTYTTMPCMSAVTSTWQASRDVSVMSSGKGYSPRRAVSSARGAGSSDACVRGTMT